MNRRCHGCRLLVVLGGVCFGAGCKLYRWGRAFVNGLESSHHDRYRYQNQ